MPMLPHICWLAYQLIADLGWQGVGVLMRGACLEGVALGDEIGVMMVHDSQMRYVLRASSHLLNPSTLQRLCTGKEQRSPSQMIHRHSSHVLMLLRRSQICTATSSTN